MQTKAALIIHQARARGLRLTTVESCTGGLVVAALTDISGASDVVESGFVTYANRAKIAVVGVPEDLLAHHGAVSQQVAIAMAEGGLMHSNSDMVIAITGIAGPGGGTPTKPVGLVHFAVAQHNQPTSTRHAHFDGDRFHIRQSAVIFALDFLLDDIVSAHENRQG